MTDVGMVERPTPVVPPGAAEEFRVELRTLAMQDTFVMAKRVLGYEALTVKCHGPLCRFLDTCEMPRRSIHMPRGHFKTTICAIASTVKAIVNDPNVRVLVISGTQANAERFILEIRKHFERNELFRWLYPEVIPQNFNTARWNNQEIEVPRTAFWREPTVDAIGASGAGESRHYDIIIADDFIGKKQYESDVEMQRANEYALSLEPLLVHPGCRIDMVGSRWRRDDAYDAVIKYYGLRRDPVPIGPHAVRQGFIAVFSRGPLEQGEPIFPERFSKAYFVRLMRSRPDYYAAQFANDPKAPGIATFQESWLRFWRWRDEMEQTVVVLYNKHDEARREIRIADMDIIVVYDPAIAEHVGSSRQAIHVVGKYDRDIVVLESHVGHFPPDLAINLLFELDLRWQPRTISIERFGFQGSIKYWLYEKAEREHRPMPPVTEFPPKGMREGVRSKDERIRGLQPFFSAGYIHVNESMTALIEEYIYYYPGSKQKDALDALAQGPYYWEGVFDEEEDERFRIEEQALLARLDATGYGFKRHAAEA